MTNITICPKCRKELAMGDEIELGSACWCPHCEANLKFMGTGFIYIGSRVHDWVRKDGKLFRVN